MNIEDHLQIRYVANFRDDSGVGDTEFGFQLRRTKMKFSGPVGDPMLKFVIRFEMDRNRQTLLGDILTIGYDLTEDVSIWAGETKEFSSARS